MTSRLRSVVAALFVMLLVVSSTVAGAGSDSSGDSTLSPADEIYIEDDGDAVLVYKANANGSKIDFGLNTSEGLFHALVVTDFNRSSELEVNATAIMTGESFTGNGTLSVPRPESLSNLSVDVTGIRTSEKSRFDMNASATISEKAALPPAVIDRARISGNVTMAPSNFKAAVEAHVKLPRRSDTPMHQEFRITEKDGTYTVDASQEYSVFEVAAQRWSTRAQAKRTLTQRYVSIAQSMGGTADLTLESYSFTKNGGQNRLDIEYTITYHGIERGLIDQLTTRLSTAEKIDLPRSEIQKITRQLWTFNINELYVKYDQRGRSIDVAMRIDLENYDVVVVAALNIAETSIEHNSSVNTSIQQFRDRFEAQQAANLEQRYTFSAVLDRKPQTTTINTELQYRTDNWKQYVQELADRGVETSDVVYELHVATNDGNITAEASFEIGQKDLLHQMTGRLLNASSKQESSRAREMIKAFQEAGFRKARMDVSIHDGRLRVETGAAFENMTELRDAFATTEMGQNVQSIVGRTENGSVKSYIRIENAVPENAAKSDVRELEYVSDDTAIHMAGSWDAEFPSTNTTKARTYLELPAQNSGLMGLNNVTLAVAGIALLGTVIIAGGIVMFRRQQ